MNGKNWVTCKFLMIKWKQFIEMLDNLFIHSVMWLLHYLLHNWWFCKYPTTSCSQLCEVIGENELLKIFSILESNTSAKFECHTLGTLVTIPCLKHISTLRLMKLDRYTEWSDMFIFAISELIDILFPKEIVKLVQTEWFLWV